MAQLSIIVIDDFLTSIDRLLAPPFPPPLPKYGQAVLARSVLESAAFAFWLMDPGIGVRQRVARAYLHLREAHKTAVKNAQAVNGDVAGAQADLSALLTEASDLGLQRTPGGPFNFAGEVLPTKTDRIAALLAGKVRGGHEIVYSLYSAVAHGEMTGILSRRLEPPTSGASPLMIITPRQLLGDVELAVVAFGQLQERLCLGGMGSSPRPLENQTWEDNVGRRLLEIRNRLA